MSSRKRDVLPDDYVMETFKLSVWFQYDPLDIDEMEEYVLIIDKYDREDRRRINENKKEVE